MKKLVYLMAGVAMMAACGNGEKGYTVSGQVEGAADGEMVYLGEWVKRDFVKLDSAAIQEGKFTFRGVQDTAVYRCVSYQAEGKTFETDFFLENGSIKVNLSPESSTAVGTANNDLYQVIKTQISDFYKQMRTTYEAMSDSTLTDEQRKAKNDEIDKLSDDMQNALKEGITRNIANPVGVLLLKQNFYSLSLEELEPLMSQIPAEYESDEMIVRIKENVEKMKATAVGQKFTDFEMLTPDGQPMKLSDYAGRGKVVLVDFWASWCGPCRREMPNIVAIYESYRDKGLEIVGVSLDREAEAWQKAIKDLNITWPQMSDLKFWNSEGARLYAVSSIPHTLLIDGEGIIIGRGLDSEAIRSKLEEVLK